LVFTLVARLPSKAVPSICEIKTIKPDKT